MALKVSGRHDGRPRLIDFFCGGGGATKGYQRAGFYVVGVDIRSQPDYCGDEFFQADALEILEGDTGWLASQFDAIHASPPCQFFTQMRASWKAQGVNDGYVDLLTPTRAAVPLAGLPYVIENVVGAGSAMKATLCLHGAMFGLRVHRPRLFESNILILAPKVPVTKQPVGVYDSRPRAHHRTRKDRNGKKSEMRIARTVEEGREAMGIDWLDWAELKEAIPPAYTEWIGRQLLGAVGKVAA